MGQHLKELLAIAKAATRIRKEFGETATFTDEAMADLDAALYCWQRAAITEPPQDEPDDLEEWEHKDLRREVRRLRARPRAALDELANPFGQALCAGCGWANHDLRKECRNCGAPLDYDPALFRRAASEPPASEATPP